MYLLPAQNSGSGYTSPASVAGISSTGSAAVTGVVPVDVDQYTGEVFIRVRGRQMALMITSNTLGTHWQLGHQRIDVRPDGRKA